MATNQLPLLHSAAPNIDDFFKDTNIFITGGSGFLGKVLIEKLLRSCTGIKNIYLLLRPKKNKTSIDRLQDIRNSSIFDKLKVNNVEALDKLQVIAGDLQYIKLGISKEDEELLKESTHIIFHVGASVRFDDSIKRAILLNTRGTKELINLAEQMKNLKVFVHVSTTYSNIDRKVIDEIVYPSQANYNTLIKMAEEMDLEMLNCLQSKILNGLPNTYVFSKSLAENIIYDHKNSFPCVIYRPSTVCNVYDEPIAGWIDTLHGAMSLIVGGGTGILHTVLGDKDIQGGWIPVDFTIRGMIISAWYQANRKDWTSCLVVNASLPTHLSVSTEKFMSNALEMIREYPFERTLWYPFVYITTNKFMYMIQLFLFHIIPAFFLDKLLAIKGDSMRLMKIYRKTHFANCSMIHFTMNDWEFLTRNFMSLDNVLKPEDKLKYKINIESFDYNELFMRSSLGINRYYFNCKNYDLKKTRAKFRR